MTRTGRDLDERCPLEQSSPCLCLTYCEAIRLLVVGEAWTVAFARELDGAR